MKFELNEDVIKAVTAQVKSIVDDTLTDILHPEFGTAYRDEKCPSDEYGNTWQSRARRLEEENSNLRDEVARLREELRLSNVKSDLGPEVTEPPGIFSYATLIDNDGDYWTQRQTLNGLHWYCDTAAVMSPKTFAQLRAEYGPLHIAPYKKK